MSIDQLRRVLTAADIELDPYQLSEALWLAAHLPRAGAPSEPPPGDGVDTSRTGGARKPPPAAAPTPPAKEPEEPDDPDDAAALHALLPKRPPDDVDAGDDLPPEDPDAAPAQTVRMSPQRTMLSTLELLRALRPLKRTVLSRDSTELDEDATAQWYAERRRWRPVTRPAGDRALDLALVVEQEPAGFWAGLSTEIAALCRRLGAFRTVSVHRLVVDPAGHTYLPPDRESGAARSPRQLLDPARRTVVLVLSDCVGAGWQHPGIHRALRHWARRGPVAILQPLPERLWSRTCLPPVPAHVTATGFARPNGELTVQRRDYPWRRPRRERYTIPVLEISPSSLNSWARLVAGVAEGGVDTAVAIAGPAGGGLATAPVPSPRIPALQRVLRFRAEASPEAYRLAGYLAAAPLHPAVMRLVHGIMLPSPDAAHLAEVLYGGLVTPAPFPGPEPMYDFLPGVRDVLLGTLRTDEVAQVLDDVSSFIDSSAKEAPAIATPSPDGPLRISPLSRPFARVRAQVLQRLDGKTEAQAAEEEAASPARRPAAPITGLQHPGSRVVLIAEYGTYPRVLPETLIEHARVRPESITQLTDLRTTQLLEDLERAARETPGLLFVHWTGSARRPDGRQHIVTRDGFVAWDVVLGVAERSAADAVVLMHTGEGLVLPANGAVPSKVYQLSTQPHHLADFHHILVHGLAGAPRQLSIEDIYTGLHQAALADRRPPPSRAGFGSHLIIGPNRAEQPPAPPDSPSRVVSCKIVVAGGFGAGKTTAVGSISEIAPLTTEAVMTSGGVGIDDSRHVPGKATLTAAMDFGRVSLDPDLIVYLFGVPGSTRFWFNWDAIVRGCIGAVVLVDTRRLADSFPPIDFIENHRLPFVVAINCFDGLQYHQVEDVRDALAIGPDVPVVAFDARSRNATMKVLITLIEHGLRSRRVRPVIRDL